MAMGDRIKRKTLNRVDEVDGDQAPLAQPLPALPPDTGDRLVSSPAERAGSVPGPVNSTSR